MARVSVEIDDRTYEEFQEVCKAQGYTVSGLIRRWILGHLGVESPIIAAALSTSTPLPSLKDGEAMQVTSVGAEITEIIHKPKEKDFNWGA